jgi:hypothetical protein
MCSGIHLQYNNECRILYNLFCCLRRRIHLSIHRLYSNNEQGVYRMYCLCRGNTEKCDLYCAREYRMYRLCSGIHVQYHYKCRHLYSMYNLSYRANTDCRLYCYDESCLCVSFSDPNGYTY